MRRLLLFFAFCAHAFSAEHSIPSSYLPATGTWAAAGIGQEITAAFIDALTISETITSTGNTTDRYNTIQTAINNAAEYSAVKLGAGDFYVSTTLSLPFDKKNRYLIGTTNADGSPATRIFFTGGTIGIRLGTQFDFTQATTGVAASFTKGSTSLEVASSSSFTTNTLAFIQLENEATTPIASIYNYPYKRGQMVWVTAKPDSTHITIASPGVHADFSGASGIRIMHQENGFVSRGNGVANIIVDATQHASYGSNLTFNAFNVENSYQSWIYNCKAFRSGNYGFYVDRSIGVQLQRVWAQGEDNGSSTAGFYLGDSAQLLVTDFVVADQQYAFLLQKANSGLVVSYGVCLPGDGAKNPSGLSQFNINHDPWPQHTLIEGVYIHIGLNDGYFGGSGYNMWYRNRIYGYLGLKRFTRYEATIGNIHGAPASSNYGQMFGLPFIGNFGSQGSSSMRAALSTLTTWTSATAGTITAPSGHGVTSSSTIDVYWSVTEGSYKASKMRRGVTVGTVSGTSIPISGGMGDDLPAQDAEIYVPTADTALRDYPIDWDSATGKMKQWTGTLTTKPTNYSGTITLGTGQGASLQASIDAAYSGDTTRGLWVTAVGNESGGTLIGFITVTNITGDVVTFNNANLPITQSTGTDVFIVPSPQNVPEIDLDVIATAYSRANYTYTVGGGEIPAKESIGSDTLANSLYLSSAPASFTQASLSWPPYNSASPVSGYTAIPAGVAYDAGWWSSASGGVQVNGTLTVTGTITLE